VLVIGPDEHVRRAVRRVLEERGYRVLDAESEKAAIYLARSAEHPVDLVLADSALPRLARQAVREGLQGPAAQARILIMSGRLNAEWGDSSDPNQGEVRLLRKPFSSDELLRAVRAALDGPTPG
jgi:DNA-binding response OmpR family regulator